MPTALIIDPHTRTIVEKEIEGYKDMLPFLPGGLCVGCGRFNDEQDTLYVDDEALLRKATGAFLFLPLGPDSQPMMGNGIICGRDDWDSNKNDEVTLDVSISPETGQSLVTWLTVEEAIAWFEKRSDVVAGSITSLDSGETTELFTYRQFVSTLKGE